MTLSLTERSYRLADLIQGLEVTLQGDPDCLITGVSAIQHATSGSITFLTNSLYKKYLMTTGASAVILPKEYALECQVNAVISQNPYYVYAKIASHFMAHKRDWAGIHATAVIGEGCQFAANVNIGPQTVIGNNVNLSSGVTIGAHCFIDDDTKIDEGTRLDAQVTIYRGVRIGKQVHVASGAVIGCDGFGFAYDHGKWHKVPQLGSVTIGDCVEIGANTTIDRGAVDDTVIETGVKLDNLIQVGHNVRIGENTVIAGCVGIAGSAVIGKNCMIGGAACIAGHITIADGAMITGMTAVSKSIRKPGIYSSGVGGLTTNQEWRKNSARFHRLEHLTQRLQCLENGLKELREQQAIKK